MSSKREKSSKRKATIPVHWQPSAELTAAAAAACGDEASLYAYASLLGGGGRDGIVEQNLLSLFNGEANQQQVSYDRAEASVALSLRVESQEVPQPPPQPALSLRVGSQEVPPQPQNRLLRHAPTQRSPSLRRAGSVPPPQTYAPGSPPAGAGAGLAPPQLGKNNSLQLPVGAPAGAGARLAPPQLGNNNSLQLPLAGAPPPEPPRCGECSLRYDRLSADLLGRVSADLDRRVGLLRQELSAEVTQVRKEVLRLHAAATAAAAAGVPRPQSARPASAFPAARGLPQPQQPCGRGAWRRCPACGSRPGTVVSEPNEHLCLCAQCSAEGTRVCLVCSFTWAGVGAVEAAAPRGRGGGRRGREGSLPPLPRPWP